jgi:hypothetical protein
MDQQFVLKLADDLKWPLVAIVVALFFIVLCRAELRDFIKRIYAISPTRGLKATQQRQQTIQIVSAHTGSDFTRDLAAIVDPYILDQRINSIYAEFDSREIKEGNREEYLVRLLAAALTREWFERIYSFILGSQIRLLQKLNEMSPGLTEEEVKSFYQSAATQFPEIYQSFKFEDWRTFLETTCGFIRNEDDRYTITPYGFGFLKYIVSQRFSFERVG